MRSFVEKKQILSKMKKYEEKDDIIFLELYSQEEKSSYPFAQVSVTHTENSCLSEIRLD